MRLGRLWRGLALPTLKPATTAVRRLPLPPRLRVPLLQHLGAPAQPCVTLGERVARFQCLGRMPVGVAGAPVHAPAAGRVVGFEDGPVALPGTPWARHVVIEVEPGGARHPFPRLDPREAPLATLRARLVDAGVVDLAGIDVAAHGGEGTPALLLVLDGVDAEPVVASKASLIVEHASDVLDAGALLARLYGAHRRVLAVPACLAEAIAARREDGADAFELAVFSDEGEPGPLAHRLMALADRDRRAGCPSDIPSLRVVDVGAALAALRAIRDGEPPVSRLVTVGGNGVHGAAVFEAAIGTPMAFLGEALGGWREDAAVLRAGGPMTGIVLPDDQVAVGKTTAAVTAWRLDDRAIRDPQPCIRCGDCAEVCPSRLQPQALHASLRAGDAAAAEAQGLAACIACGACDAVCPSAIPLTRSFLSAREAHHDAEQRRQVANAARERFERRVARLARDAEEAASTQSARVRRVSGAAAAALAKARAKRQAPANDESSGSP
jgi:electron transport complex protein RnfC